MPFDPKDPETYPPDRTIQGDIPDDDPNYYIDDDGVPKARPESGLEDPLIWLDDENVPLGYWDDALGEWVWIEDEPTPLDTIPQTGDTVLFWCVLTCLFGSGLLWLRLMEKKKNEREQTDN